MNFEKFLRTLFTEHPWATASIDLMDVLQATSGTFFCLESQFCLITKLCFFVKGLRFAESLFQSERIENVLNFH